MIENRNRNSNQCAKVLEALALKGKAILLQRLNGFSFERRHVLAGEYILKQGEKRECIYLVEVGTCSVSCTTTSNKTYSFGQFFCDNRLFGEMEVFTNSDYQFNVTACEDIEVTKIPVHVFVDILRNEPTILFWFTQTYAFYYSESSTLSINQIVNSLEYNILEDAYTTDIREVRAERMNFNEVYKEADRFGTSERAYRRVVARLIEKNLVERVNGVLEIKNFDEFKIYLNKL